MAERERGRVRNVLRVRATNDDGWVTKGIHRGASESNISICHQMASTVNDQWIEFGDVHRF